MLVGEDAQRVLSIVDDFGVLSLDEDFIACFRRGDFSAVREDFPQALRFDDESTTRLLALEETLQRYRNVESEPDFWADLRAKQFSPVLIATLAFALLARESETYNHGLVLYATLIGMEPATTIWNPVLFHHIIAHFISAQQILEKGGHLTSETRETFELARALLGHVSVAFSRGFAQMLEQELIVAFGEITMKLATGMRAEFEAFNHAIGEAALRVLGQIAETHLKYLLQFLVPALLLQFAAATVSFTARLERVRDRLLKFAIQFVVPEDEYFITFCQHLIVRAPEK
jgi:hypothetical protein